MVKVDKKTKTVTLDDSAFTAQKRLGRIKKAEREVAEADNELRGLKSALADARNRLGNAIAKLRAEVHNEQFELPGLDSAD